jgi:uncharacterized membrane protein YeaQ/YmgE (transglycosylase-associated protein family)
MKEIADEALNYLRQNLLLTVVIAFIAGFLASKTVTHWEKGSLVLYFFIGLLGIFLGQFGVRYTGLKQILDQISGMWLLFDLLAAYVGSFIIATILHLLRPM